MKNNIIKIIVGVIILILFIILIITRKSEDKSFNEIVLSTNNTILNLELPPYYDTVLVVAMNKMELRGYNVYVRKLTSEAKSKFDGELKAHVRYYRSSFYVFIDELNREESIKVICHEVIHMNQYSSGNLVYNDGSVTWLGKTIELNSKEYELRPWENDAFSKQTELIKSVKGILYSN